MSAAGFDGAALQDLVMLLKAKEEAAAQEAADKEKKEKDEAKVKQSKRKAMVEKILQQKRLTYLEIGFYNALSTRDKESGDYIDPDEAVDMALEQQKELYTSMLEFNALMSGFQFVGLSMGQPPVSNIGVAWYFAIILGFGGNACGALISFLCTMFIQGLKNEDPDVVLPQYLKYGKFFFAAQLLAIGSTFCLMVGVNIMVHEFFNDLDPYPCRAAGSADANAAECGPVPALAWTLNGISLFMFVSIVTLWYKAILAKQGNRKIFLQEEFDGLKLDEAARVYTAADTSKA